MILQLTYKEFFDEIQQINEYGKCRMPLVQKALDSIHTTYETIIAEIFRISNQIKYIGMIFKNILVALINKNE